MEKGLLMVLEAQSNGSNESLSPVPVSRPNFDTKQAVSFQLVNDINAKVRYFTLNIWMQKRLSFMLSGWKQR